MDLRLSFGPKGRKGGCCKWLDRRGRLVGRKDNDQQEPQGRKRSSVTWTRLLLCSIPRSEERRVGKECRAKRMSVCCIEHIKNHSMAQYVDRDSRISGESVVLYG